MNYREWKCVGAVPARVGWLARSFAGAPRHNPGSDRRPDPRLAAQPRMRRTRPCSPSIQSPSISLSGLDRARMGSRTEQAGGSSLQVLAQSWYQQSPLDNQTTNSQVSESFVPIGISILLDDFQYTSSPSSFAAKHTDSGPNWLRKGRFNSRLLFLESASTPGSSS